MTTTTAIWGQRDQVLQSLYISPALQTAVPHDSFEDAIGDELKDFIVKYDLPRLKESLNYYWRGAATRFFNLPSARKSLERALKRNLEKINNWLRNESDLRLFMDFYGGASEPLVGYGIHHSAPNEIRFTRALRIILQRTVNDTFVVWSAYPLLSPRNPGWGVNYEPLPQDSFITPLLSYFLFCYVSVTSDCMMVDTIVQGSTDFWKFELQRTLRALHKDVERLKDLSPQDIDLLRNELNTRCMDESLPSLYFDNPKAFITSLERALKVVVDAPPPFRDGE